MMNHGSSKEYLDFILEKSSDLDDVACSAMMRECVLYYRGKIIGGIYDDRLLVKSVDYAKKRACRISETSKKALQQDAM